MPLDENDPQGWCPFCAACPRHGCRTEAEARTCGNYEPSPGEDDE